MEGEIFVLQNPYLRHCDFLQLFTFSFWYSSQQPVKWANIFQISTKCKWSIYFGLHSSNELQCLNILKSLKTWLLFPCFQNPYLRHCTEYIYFRVALSWNGQHIFWIHKFQNCIKWKLSSNFCRHLFQITKKWSANWFWAFLMIFNHCNALKTWPLFPFLLKSLKTLKLLKTLRNFVTVTDPIFQIIVIP